MILTFTGVAPVTTTMDAAPEQLLHIISCKCKSGCATAGCSCKKAGLLCSAVCKHCVGTSCENCPQPDTNIDEIDTDDESEEPGEFPLTPEELHEDDDDDDDDAEEPVAPKRSKLLVAT